MARKNKTTLQYSSVPCDILRGKSVRRAVRLAEREGRDSDFKVKLLFVITYLQLALNGIYGGYYADCSDDFVDDFSDDTFIDEDTIRAAIKIAAQAGVIDSTLFNENNIITSESIQHAYFSAMARSRRQCPRETPYLLVDLRDYPFAGKNAENTGLSSEDTQFPSEDVKQYSEDKEITSEKTGFTTEENGITAVETRITSEEKEMTSEEKTRNNNCNNNVRYLYSDERKEIELFYHSVKGFTAWSEITDAIVAKMDPVGWMDAMKRRIWDPVKYAKAWTVNKDFVEQGSIFLDDDARQAYQELYQTLASLPDRHLLTKITFVRLTDKRLVLRVTSEEVSDFIDRNIASYKDKIKLFNGITYEKQKYND